MAALGCNANDVARQRLVAPGDVLVVDADAGPRRADGERSGVLFVLRGGTQDAAPNVQVLVEDERWLEPVDVLALPDGSLLVLDQRFADGATGGQGAVFRVTPPDASVQLWYSDARLVQPVCMARGLDGTIYVSDRSADPLGLGQPTGCVLAVPWAPDGGGPARVVAAGPELVTPSGLLVTATGRLLLLDADANPDRVLAFDGRAGTPGVLFELREERLLVLARPHQTTSPIGLIEGADGSVYVVDANAGTQEGVLGDGALFRLRGGELEPVLDTLSLGRPRALVDPVLGDALPDGRLVLADANADPAGRGADGTGKGVYGTGPGCVLLLDPAARSVEVLAADERFVTPLAARSVRW